MRNTTGGPLIELRRTRSRRQRERWLAPSDVLHARIGLGLVHFCNFWVTRELPNWKNLWQLVAYISVVLVPGSR